MLLERTEALGQQLEEQEEGKNKESKSMVDNHNKYSGAKNARHNSLGVLRCGSGL